MIVGIQFRRTIPRQFAGPENIGITTISPITGSANAFFARFKVIIAIFRLILSF